jgi:phenylacetic acid degradation operon negative regulatory protein
VKSSQGLPARKSGAKALLLTVLGEFVLPGGGQAWTSSLVASAAALGIGEKNARQALARIGDQGFIERSRHGRAVRWGLTESGRELLQTGTERIYSFGRSEDSWDGRWLVAHCPVAESQRAVRDELRRQLGFLGFGELSPSLLVSPHPEREQPLRGVLDRLNLLEDSTILWSNTIGAAEDGQLVSRAWNLDQLAASYSEFIGAHGSLRRDTPESAFVSVVELVHDWRRFPFVDPDLPTELLPDKWPGTAAVARFHDCHAAVSTDAQAWFASLESRW